MSTVSSLEDGVRKPKGAVLFTGMSYVSMSGKAIVIVIPKCKAPVVGGAHGNVFVTQVLMGLGTTERQLRSSATSVTDLSLLNLPVIHSTSVDQLPLATPPL